MPSIPDLAPHDDDGNLRVVVETRRNGTLKLAFLYDVGFIPGTRADDGNPLDAVVPHSSCSYPGAILPWWRPAHEVARLVATSKR